MASCLLFNALRRVRFVLTVVCCLSCWSPVVLCVIRHACPLPETQRPSVLRVCNSRGSNELHLLRQ
jgi:hypothetical protein